MKVNELIDKINNVLNSSTMYLQGASGQRLTKANQLKLAGSSYFNSTKAKLIYASDENTRAFDVIGFISFLLRDQFNNIGEVIGKCIDISKDFSVIIPGEAVFLKDRVGVFIGGGKVATANENGIVTVPLDGWISHGKFASVEYARPETEVVKPEEKVEEKPESEPVSDPTPVEVEEEIKNEDSGESRQEERRVEFRHDRGRNRH